MSKDKTILKELKDAWNIEGKYPLYHRQQKELIKKNWYFLYKILNRLND